MDMTKDLMGANDTALGNVNPDQASGKAIIAVMEQSQVPLERIRRRYFDFVEDISLIWADMWRCYTPDEKQIIAKNENGEQEAYRIRADAFNEMMLMITIDVGASNRWGAEAEMETLQNLLSAKYITFEEFLELIPDNSFLPVKKLKDIIEKREKQTVKQEENQNKDIEYSREEIEGAADELIKNQTPDVDQVVDNISPQDREMYLNNPKMLTELFKGKMSLPADNENADGQ